ncbi:MAG: aromatic amino acid transport family protein [bacterium]|nr:aromatic amino acid transport family protein [bacterium]
MAEVTVMAENKHNGNFWLAVFSLVGTTIGAGIFSLPYAFFKAGFVIGLIEFIALVAAVLLIQLIIGEIALRTKGKKRFIGYAEEYLGYKWKLFVTISTLLGGIGVLLVYIILAGHFLSFLISQSAISSSLIFFAIWFLFILAKPKMFGKTELIFSFSVISIIILISSFNIGYIDFNNFKGLNIDNLLLPYGVILFAISGYYVIPEMEDIIGTPRRKLKKAIVYGTLIPATMYLFFVFVVLGVSGSLTSPDAISGLADALNSRVIILLGSFLGLLAVSGASLSYGIYIKETLWYDFKINKWSAWFLTGAAPLALFLLGARNLVAVISIIGALFFAFQAVVVLLIHKKSKSSEIKPDYEIKLPNFVYYLIGLMAIFGALLEVWYNII